MAKIIKYNEVSDQNKLWQGEKSVLIGGCFDIFHYGHYKFIQKAKKKGEFLIVLLESDRFIQENKNKTPIHTQRQRAEILSVIKYVDVIVILPYFKKRNEQYFKLVEKIHPDLIAITEGDKFVRQKQAQAKRIGAKLEVVTPLLKKFSSSKILDYETIFGN